MSHIIKKAQILEHERKAEVTIDQEELRYLYDRIIDLTFQIDRLKIELDFYKNLKQNCDENL